MDIYRSVKEYLGDADYRPIACDMCCQDITGPFVEIDHGEYRVPFVCLPCMKKAVEQMEAVE